QIPHGRCLQLPFPVTDTPLVLACLCIYLIIVRTFREHSPFLELNYSFWTLGGENTPEEKRICLRGLSSQKSWKNRQKLSREPGNVRTSPTWTTGP
ncbi:mCG145453, partial [Mus musculus]